MRFASTFTALALLTAACGGGGVTAPETTTVPATTTTAPPLELARADVPRISSTDVSDAELTALVTGNTRFAFDLFHRLAADENLLLSPYSVAAALTMTYAGARGTTASEMADVLSLGLDDHRIHAARNELDLLVTATPDPGDDREPFTIKVANSLWGQRGYPFLEEFLVLLAEQYDAGMHLVDFVAAAQDARRTINDWVEDETEGRIVDLIPEGAITGLTRLVLVNAIWFKANWAEQFSPDDTADGPFTRLDGSVVTVPMMHRSGRIEFVEGDGYVAARLPYAGDASMLVIVPDDGRFSEVAAAFGPDDLDRVRGLLSTHQVDLTLPRFEFRSELGLKPPLRELGMVAAFVEPSRPDGADLTGMTAERELFVHDVVHQAFISVDEQGTEAAAATAVIVGLESAPPPATLTADRPFLFLIQHDPTGEILFLGQVTDPS